MHGLWRQGLSRTAPLVVALAILAGCGTPLKSPPEPLVIAEALAQWEFSGFGGGLNISAENVSWFHMAVPIDDSLDDLELSIDLSWRFRSADEMPSALLVYTGFNMSGLGGGLPSRAERCLYPSGSERCGDFPETHISVTEDRVKSLYNYKDRYHIYRPIFQLFVVFSPDTHGSTLEARATWKNAIANASYGDTGGFFYNRSAFSAPEDIARGDGQAGYDAPIGGIERNLTVPDGQLMTFFHFFAPSTVAGVSGDNTMAGAEYVRPDGSTHNLRHIEAYEFTSLDGEWEFSVRNPETMREGSVPVLWGTAFPPARIADSGAPNQASQ